MFSSAPRPLQPGRLKGIEAESPENRRLLGRWLRTALRRSSLRDAVRAAPARAVGSYRLLPASARRAAAAGQVTAHYAGRAIARNERAAGTSPCAAVNSCEEPRRVPTVIADRRHHHHRLRLPRACSTKCAATAITTSSTSSVLRTLSSPSLLLAQRLTSPTPRELRPTNGRHAQRPIRTAPPSALGAPAHRRPAAAHRSAG